MLVHNAMTIIVWIVATERKRNIFWCTCDSLHKKKKHDGVVLFGATTKLIMF